MIYFQPWIIEVTPTDEGQVKIDVCSRNICRIRAHPSQAAAMPSKESMLKLPSISRSQLSFRWLTAARDQKQLTEGTGICEECSDQVVIVKKLELTYPDFFLIIFSLHPSTSTRLVGKLQGPQLLHPKLGAQTISSNSQKAIACKRSEE